MMYWPLLLCLEREAGYRQSVSLRKKNAAHSNPYLHRMGYKVLHRHSMCVRALDMPGLPARALVQTAAS